MSITDQTVRSVLPTDSGRRPRLTIRNVLLGLGLIAGLGTGAWYGDYWWTMGRFIVSTDDAWTAELVLKVKEPQAEEFARLRIGVAGYPEGHPAVSGATLLDSLRRKQPRADYITTQICFDADALVRWLNAIRSAGIELPVIVGLPGPVERRKLAEISLRAGVGASLRYLTRHHRSVVALARARRYDPTALAVAVGAHLDEPGLGIAGVHLFTFNRVEETQAWVRRMGSE